MRVVGVKFCGNCNPQINSMEIFAMLRQRFPQYRFVTGSFAGISCLVIFSGCEVNCATRPEVGDVPVITVAGHTLERVKLSPEELKHQLIRRLEGQSC